MNPFKKEIVGSQITGTWFGFYTREEIIKLSVKQVTSPISIDELGTYLKDGLYDPAFGPQNAWDMCESCGLSYEFCPGHPGHIELAVPVYHPILFNIFYKLLRSICFHCHRLRMPEDQIRSYTVRFKLLSLGKLKEAVVYLNSGDISRYAKTLTDILPNLEDFSENVDTRRLNQTKKKKKKSRSHPNDSIKELVDRDSLVTNVVAERKQIFKMFLADANAKRKCPHCQAQNPNLRKNKDSKIFQSAIAHKEEIHNLSLGVNVTSLEQNIGSTLDGSQARYITTKEAKTRITKFFENESELVQELFKAVFPTLPGAVSRRVDPTMFFCEVLMVPPSRFRPSAKGALGEMEHPQNVYFKRILNLNHQLYELQVPEEGKKIDFQKMINTVIELQEVVNKLMSNDVTQNAADPVGIKQLLEKKQGLFRKHMMGKRVNFAARSVISPDPFINTNQIGVPEVFAKRLTFPQPVTEWNYKELCERVINGPDIHPGANMIEDDRGFRIILRGGDENYESRVAASKTLLAQKSSDNIHRKSAIVYRHLQDGDYIVMNRQPTLHKPSMMSHRALVQKNERVIRMHYANCKTFNADFDGDEMNMHFPQTQLARADVQELMFSDKQYIAPTNGAPLRGLIQDHIISSVLLTKRDTFFTKDEFQQLFYSATVTIEKPLIMPKPCIIKPKPLWTGKQLISAILKHLTSEYPIGMNLQSKSQISKELWANDEFEQTVIFRNGELLTGVLDKAQIGAASFGMVHCCYELYGPTMAGLLLSVLGRLFTLYLQFHGFTCGIDDLIINKEGNKRRTHALKRADIHGASVAQEFSKYNSKIHNSLADALRDTLTDDTKFAKLDTLTKTKVNQLTTEVIGECIPSRQMKKFPKNFLSLMTISGAKGSQVNVSQISCLLGQQELEGRRVPVMASGKTLPSFPPYDTRARAGGYIADRFLTGIRPQEYFFHCMAGREGLVDTAVKTSNSGYLQRCLIKHLEDMIVGYDYTVRDADGSVVQFNFGEDCIDTCQTKFLDRFDFLAGNMDTLDKQYNLESTIASGAFQIHPIIEYHNERSKLSKKIKNKKKTKKNNNDNNINIQEDLDPLLSLYNPGTHLGCISENYEKVLDEFIEKDPIDIFSSKSNQFNFNGLKKITKDRFRMLMLLKYRKSMVHPGEAVGVVAGQSIGEPSTQMTLNTFHLAGHGGANVTLGIPRLREIIMSATAEIKTPMMTLPLKENIKEDEAYEIGNRFYRLLLPELLQEVTVSEELQNTAVGSRVRAYKINLFFYDDEMLSKEHSMKFKLFAEKLAGSFIPVLHSAITKEIKTHCSDISSSKFTAVQDLPNTSGSIDENSVSATEQKMRQKKAEFASYDDDDEDDDDNDENNNINSRKNIDILDNDEDDFEDENSKKSKNNQNYDDDDEEEEEEEEDEEDDDIMEDVKINVSSSSKKETTKKPTKKPTKKVGVNAAFRNLRYLRTYNCDYKSNKLTIELHIPASDKKLLMVSLVERIADSFVVNSVKGIEQAYIENKEGRFYIITNGVNIQEIWNFEDVIDIHNIKCNHIHKIRDIYGIEAARGCLISEIKQVFGAYGIKVDPRHLSLVADYMTFSGEYKACNRVHMDAKASPWLKMSFETTMKFLSETALSGGFDPIRSPSASLVVGNPACVGTAFMDIRQKLI